MQNNREPVPIRIFDEFLNLDQVIIIPIEGYNDQSSLKDINTALKEANITYDTKCVAITITGHGIYGYLLTLGTPTIGAFATICVTWIRARANRHVKLKIGDITASANSAEELEKLLLIAERHQISGSAGKRNKKTSPKPDESN